MMMNMRVRNTHIKRLLTYIFSWFSNSVDFHVSAFCFCHTVTDVWLFFRYWESLLRLSFVTEGIMIKSTFSRNAKKLPPSCSSKKPSLASLAQKLQGVSITGTPKIDSALPCNKQESSVLLSLSSADDGNVVLGSPGRCALTSDLTGFSEDRCSNDSTFLTDEDSDLSPASQDIPNAVSLKKPQAASSSRSGKNNFADDLPSVEHKPACGSVSLNDCLLEFGRLDVNRCSQVSCQCAKPSPFAQTLSAVPRPSTRAGGRHRRSEFIARFSYTHQMAAQIRRHPYSSVGGVVKPFDFSTPSPDDVVRQKQKPAFGISVKKS